MIPLKDDNPTGQFPLVTIGLIAANVLVYIYQLTLPSLQLEALIFRYGAIPYNLTHPLAKDLLYVTALPAILTVFSSLFLHGGFLHLASNMLYLWIFGDNIEDYLGHLRFMLFYLISGFFAALFHTLADINATIPVIGASGAIAGILGAYLVLFPRANVSTLFLFIIIVRIIKVPAVLILGLWFLIQLLNAGSGGAVAWFAHIGGFLTGMILIKVFRSAPRPARYSGLR
ncbi:MAG: rhomboid family intramembrane serine protease [Deltaproteobacteria bacterium]|nr:rhomboid family intramembrane serine protease [Deltaproteobacteria bacterium]